MLKTTCKATAVLILFAVFQVLLFRLTTQNASAQSFIPPTHVPITMYVLDLDGSYLNDTKVLCEPADDRFGCTAEAAIDTYPYATNPVTVTIDGTAAEDRYLRDVVPLELGIRLGSQGNKPLAAVEAQAVTSRTYVYHRVQYIDQYGTNGTIDNSDRYQVFVPYFYDTLTGDQKARVDAAMTNRLYMTEPDSTYPIEALFGADNGATTSQGNRPYLKSVPDPISSAYGTSDGTANGGLSSRGASRWSFGHTSSWGPVAPEHSNYPHDINGLGDFWGVRYDRSAQILTHYYTGIHLRDATAGNAIVTPPYRWNPLQIDVWANACAGLDTPLEIQLQNTGTTTWAANSIILVKTITSVVPPGQAAVDELSAIPDAVAPGQSVLYSDDLYWSYPGTITYSFDLYSTVLGETFDEQQPEWPEYAPLTVEVHECDSRQFIPNVRLSS